MAMKTTFTQTRLAESINRQLLKYCVLAFAISFILYLVTSYQHTEPCVNNRVNLLSLDVPYDDKYPLSAPQRLPDRKMYKIGVIADLDKDRSKSPGKSYEWRSYLKTGYLTVHQNGEYKVEFTDTYTITSNLNEKGRGLELSELCVFNNKLYSVDDRTGVVYQIYRNEPIPWVILQDGNGLNKKGFKSEWMTVKNGMLYVGSTGKEFTTTTGKFLNDNPMFVKVISPGGQVAHYNWTNHYKTIRRNLGLVDPGYVMHEAAAWSDIKQKWFFLPRRLSALQYDDELDERRGTNVLISASLDFKQMKVIYVGDLDVTHGFSSFKFIPGTNDDLVIALKTKEVGDDISSYVTIFDVNTGRTVMQEEAFAKEKYEGIEFL